MSNTEPEGSAATAGTPGAVGTGGVPRPGRGERRLGWAAAALAAAAGAAWLLDALGRGWPRPLSRALVVLAVEALIVWAVLAVGRQVRRRPGHDPWPARLLVVLAVASVALRVSGLDFELIDHYSNDEGWFLAWGRRINDGQVLIDLFNYGHLLYYASALALWVRGLFPEAAAWLASLVFDRGSALEVEVLMPRLVTAVFAALTPLPVFGIGRRIAGPAGGLLAAALITLSPLYDQVGHLAISDVPAGFFAALTLLFAARLSERERLRDYLLGGLAAGLAAASKYPAGVAALGLAGVWIFWRWRLRRFSWSLVAAAATAVVAMLLVMPSLWLLPEAVVGGQFDILMGIRVYSEGGWIGVQPPSNALYYLDLLRYAFGLPALVLGVAGAALLSPERRRRWLLLLPFPVAFFALISSMNLVVERNLQPLQPVVAGLLGAGLAACAAWLGRRRPGAARLAAAAVAVLALALPLWRSVSWEVSQNRPGTRQVAAAWIVEHVPHGAAFIKESYSPRLDPARYVWHEPFYAASLGLEEIRQPQWDYLLLSGHAFLHYLDPRRWREPHHQVFAERYRRMFELDLVRAFAPGRWRTGPLLRLYRLDPEHVVHLRNRRFEPGEAGFLTDPEMLGEDRIDFARDYQLAVFKEYLDAGRYEVTVRTWPREAAGWVRVVTRDNLEVGLHELPQAPLVTLPRADKYFFQVTLVPPSRLRSLRVAEAAAADR